MEVENSLSEHEKNYRNYYTKDGIAYTEDHLPIYNVFVCRIPTTNCSTEADILKYFSQFGEVREIVWFAATEDQPNRQSAYIYFEKSSSATSVLQNGPHYLVSDIIQTNACNSWLQPGGVETFSHSHDDTKPTLLDLFDDCLYYIFENLQLADQVRFARTCERFRNIFEMIYRRQWNIFQTDKFDCNMTLWEQRQFLEITGPNIETLIVRGFIAEEVFNVFGNYLKSVKRLDMCGVRIKRTDRRIYSGDEELTSTGQHQQGSEPNVELLLQNYDILSITNLTNLEYLNLSDNTQLTGMPMDKGGVEKQSGPIHILSGLKELDLTGCCHLEATHLKAICKSLQELQKLNITWQDNCQCETIASLSSLKQLTVEVLGGVECEPAQLFVALAEHKASQLEYLAIKSSGTWNITPNDAAMISRLVALKQLVFTNFGGVSDESLQLFSELENLEELETGRSNLMTNTGLLSVVSKCLKLKRILVLYSLNITDAFVLKAIEVIGQRQTLPKEPLLLQFPVGSTRVRRSILNNSQYLAAATSLIKVSFEYEMDDDDSS